ncbi:ketopantoate reductase family protein [Haloarchaeobius sp. HRN-SO-5]|uniref:ketopantoate reductase family protein n=1 Tax=Haloarchaeobius sp. HRN-SO-5 TaxID=3446118 RepID=UPI003EBBB055
MRIVVYGAGSLGSLVGGICQADGHEVTLVGRDPHVSAVQSDGLRVEFPDRTETVHPRATTDGTGLDADLALVTVKAFDTGTAARDLATGTFDAVCSLQNGMGNEETLAAHLDCPVYAGTVTYGAMLREPGVVACTGLGDVVFGPAEGGTGPADDLLTATFGGGGFVAELADDMPRRLWEKLAVNAGINAVTALVRVENGALLDGTANGLACDAARETARVARGHDVWLPNRVAVGAVEAVADATAANTSSMLRDVERERRTEVDAITGFVVDRARTVRDADVSVPVCETTTRLLRAWEEARGLGSE